MNEEFYKRLLISALFAIMLAISISSVALSSSPPCIFKEIDVTFGGASDDWGQSILQTDDGGYIVAGTTSSSGAGKSDVWLKKIDRSGNEIWDKTFGGPRDDEAFSVVETDRGEFIVAGRTKSYGQGAYDAWLIKVDRDGNKLWDRTFGGPLDDEGNDVRQTEDGGFVIAGRTRSSGENSDYDVWLIKVDRSGNRIWDRTFGGPQDDAGDSIQQTDDGGYVIAGTTNSYGAGGFDALLIRTDREGNEVWEKTYGGPGSEQNPWSRGWSVLQNSDGSFMLVGSTESFGAGGYDLWLVKTDANGEPIADETYGGQFNDEGSSIAKLTDNEYILAGSTSSFGKGGYDAWLIKIDKNGNKIWDQTYGGPDDDKAYSIAKTDDEGYIFAGKMRSAGFVPQFSGCSEVCKPKTSANFDLWLVKTRSGSPTIRSQPAGLVACEGEDVAFEVEASGTEPLKYQWKKDGKDIIGATANGLQICEVSVDDSGIYTAMVSNSCGWIESDGAVLEVNSRPSILSQPLSQEISEDESLSLTVEASGTEPLSYQWMKEDQEIPGANAASLSVPDVSPEDAGKYRVIVSNRCGQVESEPAVITVNLKPVIEVQPTYQEACEGSEIALNVEATGTEPLFYQWTKNGEIITGADSSIFHIHGASPEDSGNYSVVVSNCCGLIESSVASLTVLPKPSILVQPVSQMACKGAEVRFAVEATGIEPLSYQWKKNGENITGANEKVYVMPRIAEDDAGSYSVLVISCCCGEINSNPATLTVNLKPSIAVQPQSQNTCEGSPVQFSVQASGTEPMSYQWMKNGAEIPGEVSPSLQIKEVMANDAGGYSVTISNCCGLVVSGVASLNVDSRPSIIVQPQSQVVCQDSEVSFCVQAGGTEPLEYQWARDGADIPGANQSCFAIPGASLDSAGSYSVRVSNRCGQTVSEAAALQINVKPSILVQPMSQMACEGSPVTFSVQARGSMPLEYQWLKDGTEIPGANLSLYAIPVASADSAGNYSVLIGNGCGQATSVEAALEISMKPSILVGPRSRSACEGSEVIFEVQAAGTEPLGYQWMKDGIEILGANLSTYVIPVVSTDSAGSYSAVVSNVCGQARSNEGILEINQTPSILIQPQSQAVCEGSQVTFSVLASGTEPFSYQWMKDGIEIPGASSSNYTIASASTYDAGGYSVIVGNSCARAESEIAALEIYLKPSVLIQPKSQVACEGSQVTFSVLASGTEPLSYQWMKDGIEIPEGSYANYTIPQASADYAGTYSVLVSNSCGQTVSDQATLEIRTKPSISLQPRSQAVCEGGPVLFRVEAAGSGPLSYQWQKEGIDIAGAIASSYEIPVSDTNSSGTYNVVVSNDCGQVRSDQATLTIDLRPSIVVQPKSQVVCEGSDVAFNVEADGTGPLSYQWMKDGSEIPGAVSGTYSIQSASQDSAGNYSVAVSNCCGLAISSAAELTIETPPSIVVSPQGQTVCEGSEVTFSVQAAGTEPLSYQWSREGAEIAGANSSLYSISSASIDVAGSYAVVVSNNCGQAVSEPATLNVKMAPSIMIGPKSQTVCEGSQVAFSVEAVGTEPFSYQWSRDGIEIPGANGSTYEIPAAMTDSAGGYSVLVKNGCGQAISGAAALEIYVKPSILVQPESQSACLGSEVSFSVLASGTEPLSYQWMKDGIEIPDANSTAYTMPSISIDSSGNYSVVVSNVCGKMESNAATLDINLKPSILVQPESQKACEGSQATFSVQASGTEPLGYQWMKDGVEIPDATSSNYIMPSVGTDSAGIYSVIVSNSCGRIESGAAALDINLKPSILVQPESQVACEGLPVTFSVLASGTEPLGYQWKKDGIEIPEATSSNYTIPSLSGESTGSYSVIVRNDCGQTTTNLATLEMRMRPTITLQPQSLEVCDGSEVVFRVEATGSGPLSYQWLKDGAVIPGASASSYAIPAADVNSSGSYSAIVSNDCGQVDSDEAVLKIALKPSILVEPQSQAACEGSNITFEVQADGTRPLSYQWMKDGIEIYEAQSSAYTVSGASLESAGNYSVAVSNCCGLDVSETASLTVDVGPSIILPPESQVVCEGSDVVFAVKASGSAPLSYQWLMDGAEIPGADSTFYEISNVSAGSAGRYSVIVSNRCGQAESCAATLNIASRPYIVVQPGCQVVCEGEEVTFCVQASGAEPLSYQWKKDGVDIEGASSDCYLISCATAGDAGIYSVAISNGCGQVESGRASLVVNFGPQILVQPVSQVACSGTTVTFSVQAGGTGPLSYQWTKDGVEIPDAIAETYTIAGLEVDDAGSYSVIVQNSCGEASSEPAFLTVGLKPAIKSQPRFEAPPMICAGPCGVPQPAAGSLPLIVESPSSQVVCKGSVAKFSVQCEGEKPLNYQWLRDGTAIPGAGSDRYTIFNAVPEDEGRYSVIASNPYGSVESCPAGLRVIVPPAVAVLPSCQVAGTGTSVSFVAKVRGTGPLAFQWKKDGRDIPGANSATYFIRCVDMADAGCYRVTVTDSCCTSESDEVCLKVQDAGLNYCCSQEDAYPATVPFR
ncbi:MAG: hypothetical protein HPY61_10750 [Methanotrichaceae archaeon]|nr:hypothetical protein [Methanotrichaceae archaeon]